MMAVAAGSEMPLDEVYQRLRQHEPAWLDTILREKWQQLAPQKKSLPPSLASLQRVAATEQVSMGPYDITSREVDPERLTEHIARFRSHDWASTDLGPMSSWPAELRCMVNFCMADPRPVALWLGPKRVGLYNLAYRISLADRDAWALGKPFAEVWHDVPLENPAHRAFDIADATGQPSFGDDACFFVERNGRTEEVWASWAVIPIPGANSNIGYYNSANESTRQVTYERRMATLLALERHTAQASNLKDFWKRITAGLEPNRADVPFAVLYSATSETQSGNRSRTPSESDVFSNVAASSSSSSGGFSSLWTLEWALKATDALELPGSMASDAAADIFGPLFKTAIETRVSQVLRSEDGTFPEELRAAAVSRAYGDCCKEAILFPLCQGHRKHPSAFLLLGVNSRSSYGTDYQRFTSLLTRQLTTSMTAVAMAEAEARHVEMSAELALRERMQLSERLNFSEHDAKEKEVRFRTMASRAPVAMFEVGPNGELNYANDAWYKITGHPRDDFTPAWVNTIHADDRELFGSHYAKLLAGQPCNFELRYARPFVSDEFLGGERLQGETWVSAFAYSELNLDGSVRSMLGCAVDISYYKWMQNHQERRTAEALELKRQQEAFMDMTSHEARNPLAAISLCVESILDTFRTIMEKPAEQFTITRDTLESMNDSAETVMACVAHQKCIIDDVLTLSKLDSGLLVVSPVEIQPFEEVSRALKLFDGELHQADIDLRVTVDQSYRDLHVNWVMLDPVRLLQVLMNLLTNAIKFTKDEAIRSIAIDLSASRQRPKNDHGVKFISNTDECNSERGLQESEVYISVMVKDTGRGIESRDLEHLFQRFQQGSPKTHVKYGGSGLGLFICKNLARLQGGEIGVSSTFGQGSTFAFFVKATHCPPPEADHATVHVSRNVRRNPSISGGSVKRRKPSTMISSNILEARRGHVLLVEDNLVNQRVMAKQIRRAGYEVSIANHGLEALDYIHTTHFCTANGADLDIVLMDIEMPVMGGLECTRRIRAMQLSSEIRGRVPLIAVTANARAEQQNDALGAGFDAVITKPFRMDDLLPELDWFCVTER